MKVASQVRYRINIGRAKRLLHPERWDLLVHNSRLTKSQRARLKSVITLEMLMELFRMKPEINWLMALDEVVNPFLKQPGSLAMEKMGHEK